MALIASYVIDGVVADPPPPSTAVLRVTKSKEGAGHMAGLQLLQIEVFTHTLHRALAPMISDAPADAHVPSTITMWVPEMILTLAHPQLALKFNVSSSCSFKLAMLNVALLGHRWDQGHIIQMESNARQSRWPASQVT